MTDIEPEITFSDVFSVIWTKRWQLLLITMVATAIAGTTSFVVHKKYTASITISVVTGTSANGPIGAMGGLASQFGGLAALAGLSTSNDAKKAETLAVLQSESLTQEYIRENDLLPVLYPKLWDDVAKKWRQTDAQGIPTLWKANLYFRNKIRSVVIDPKTGLVTVTIFWTDPTVAATWANGLVRMTNNFLRTQEIQGSERNIAYLTEQASKTDVLGVKQAIYAILQNEIDKVMLARGNDEFALKVVDAAFVPEVPSSPKLSLWLLIGFASGLFASLLLIFAQTSSPLSNRQS